MAKSINITWPTMLRDALENCCEANTGGTFGENENPARMYARGIINGMVAAFMSQGLEFSTALALVKKHVRTDSGAHGRFDSDSIPTAFWHEWNDAK